jgi:quercetin dioxygenase-like cupin family protein
VSEADASAPLRLPGGVEARIRVSGAETDGSFVLLTDVAPPGWSLPPHSHTNESETIHITSGSMWLDVDGDRRDLVAGHTAFIPRGTRHSGGTLGDQPVQRVLVFSPAGMEDFFTAVASTADRAAMLDLATKHGWVFS